MCRSDGNRNYIICRSCAADMPDPSALALGVRLSIAHDLRLDLLQRQPPRLRHLRIDEGHSREGDERELAEQQALPEVRALQIEEQGHEEIGPEIRESAHGHGRGPDLEREHLRQNQPRHGAKPDLVAPHEGHNARDHQALAGPGRAAEGEEGAEGEERQRHAGGAVQEQGAAAPARVLHQPHADEGHDELEDPDADGRLESEPRALEDAVGVVQHRGLPRQLLEQDQPHADGQGLAILWAPRQFSQFRSQALVRGVRTRGHRLHRRDLRTRGLRT
mmetsp:Transcript_75690/g.127288  ORF Transcript_75690/g.127288 Transcript_75690/m.127288 type:complete len:276 (-) Transcript_75690:37-864(-)